LGLRIEPPDGPLPRLSSFYSSLELILAVDLPNNSLSHNGSLIHLTFISDASFIEDDLSFSMRLLIKLTTIGIFFGDNNEASSLHLSILPIPNIILLSFFMLDPLQIVSIANIIIVYNRTTVTLFALELLKILLGLVNLSRLI